MGVREQLEAIAKNYHLSDAVPDKFIEDACQRHCCEWIGDNLMNGDKVLELGFGDGITASTLSKRVTHYSIIEGAPSLQEEARHVVPEATIVDSLFEDFRPSVKYDRVLALHVLEHVDNPRQLLDTMRNWLATHGELIVVVPNRNSLHRQLAVLMGLQSRLDTLSKRDELVGHQRVYDLAELEADIVASGFEIIERKGFFLKPLPNSMMLEFSEALVDALNKIGNQLPIELLANIAVRVRVKSSV
jgi:2-polyprenyl-3-methyl-5-hydroxy-6-metoxy-1,4-benzoquinol methylase